MKILCVGGHFDNNGGRPSSIVNTLGKYADTLINGGHYGILEKIIGDVPQYDVIYWFADVPNDMPKLLYEIKKLNPKAVLVTSKRNYYGEYAIHEIIQRMLKTHSNLLVEFASSTHAVGYSRPDKSMYAARVLDPLGNCFCEWTLDLPKAAEMLHERVLKLLTYTRVPSIQQQGPISPYIVDEDFVDIIHQHSLRFHQLIYGDTPIDRFLGNASFRCTKGFPSFKQGDQVYVTRRNINKTMLDASCFVPVTALFDKDDRCTSVLYEGIFKPSVDTPIQLMLYNYYKNAKFMIHSHVYTEPECEFDQFMTSTEPIPCGALEEFDEIIRLVPDREACSFAVNLRGHGCIVIADNLNFLKTVRYRGRMMPEPISQY